MKWNVQWADSLCQEVGYRAKSEGKAYSVLEFIDKILTQCILSLVYAIIMLDEEPIFALAYRSNGTPIFATKRHTISSCSSSSD